MLLCAVRPQVESIDDEPKQPFEPYHTRTDGTIVTRWLNQGFPFNISAIEPPRPTAYSGFPYNGGASSPADAANT